MKRGNRAGRILFFVLIGVLAIGAFTFLVMLLWNNVLVAVTPVRPVTFFQAFGILVLSKLLFGGFRGGWGRRRYGWKQRMTQKWNTMTPEEKEKFKQEWQRRCGTSNRNWEPETTSTPTQGKPGPTL